MRRWCIAGALTLLPGLAHGQSLSVSHLFDGPVDGTALGNVDGDAGLELAVITREGTSAAALRILDDDGDQLLGVTSAVPLGGFPVLADFDGDHLDEPAYCELHARGMCRILDGDGSLLAEFGPYYFPGMTTAGPAAADVDGDGKAELVIATYGGLVAALSTEGVLWQADTWLSHDEMYFGHPALEDVDGDGQLEVLVVGARRGSVLSFDARSGQIEWQHLDLYGQYSNYAYANGALATDMDGDGNVEVVVALVGYSDHAVFAFDGTSGTLRSRLPLPGADLAFSTPVALDSGAPTGSMVYVQGGEGILRRLSLSDGQLSVSSQVDLGQRSWVAPAFVDTSDDGTTGVLASTTEGLVLIDSATMTLTATFPSPAGGLMPTSVVGDADHDGRVDIITASWWGQSLLRMELNSPALHSWTSLGGGARHAGTLSAPAHSPSSSTLSFEATDDWSITTGSGGLSPSPISSDGAVGLSIAGGGFIEVISPPMTTAMVRQTAAGGVPGRAVLDVLVQPGQPNPFWLGAVQLYFDIPSAGLYHRYVGQQSLTGLTIGQYGQLSFDLPAQLETILLGDYQDVRISIAVNTPSNAPAVIVDHLRFAP